MTESKKIASILSKKKKEMIDRGEPCVFCGHGFGPSSVVQLAHLIRRSERTEGMSNLDLQTMDENIGLAHPQCHEVFDDRPESAINLPNIFIVLDRIRSIDELYYNRMVERLAPYFMKQIERKKKESVFEYRATKETESYIDIFINKNFTNSRVAKQINWRKRK